MKRKAQVAGLIVGLSTVGLTTLAQAAPLTNGGFESGLSGWTSSLSGGSATVVPSNTTNYSPGDWGTNHTFLPYGGSSFLAIAAGDAGVWQTVSQTVTLAAGESIGGAARFDWGDYYVSPPNSYPDGAKVEILDAFNQVVATPFYFDGSMACPGLCSDQTGLSGYETPWTLWSFSANPDFGGTFTVVYGARNTGDGGGPNQTYGYFDDVGTAPIPEPETYAMLLAGLGLLGFAARRRKQKEAAAA